MNKKIMYLIPCLFSLVSCGLYNNEANQVMKTSDDILEEEFKANGSLCGLAFKAFDNESNIIETYQFQELNENEEYSNTLENFPNFISFLDVEDSYDLKTSPFYQHVVTYTIPYCANKSTAVQTAGIYLNKETNTTKLLNLGNKVMGSLFSGYSCSVKGLYGLHNNKDYCCTYKAKVINVTGYEGTRIEVSDANKNLISNVRYTEVSKVPTSFEFTTGETVKIFDTYSGTESLTDTLTESGSVFFGFTDENGFSSHHRVGVDFK